MAGRQLPFVSILIPFWLVTTFVLMQGGKLKDAWEVWPATLCSGASFAIMQFFASQTTAFHLMTDVVSGVFSVICTALFLRFVWHPKTRFLLKSERQAAAAAASVGMQERPHSRPRNGNTRYTIGQTAYAWVPWAILIACCAIWGMPTWKAYLNTLFAGVKINTTLLGSAVGRYPLPARLANARTS